jgi:hypothetical protein
MHGGVRGFGCRYEPLLFVKVSSQKLSGQHFCPLWNIFALLILQLTELEAL